MKEKTISQTIKGYNVRYTVRTYYGASYYYLHEIDNISLPECDPFPKKRDLTDFVSYYHETKDINLSFRLNFRPEGMNIKDAIKLLAK